ncbi:hypothetical protein DFJ74DRAFT_291973 [Hyaloraphidium curvatum]|nr:hypothetical protein DFJ74DRAFT_291973 [Hyaloraphidium curvatum]
MDENAWGAIASRAGQLGQTQSPNIATRRTVKQQSFVRMASSGPGRVVVYQSVYSGIPVYEMLVRNVSVMRRKSDSWLNATQILKVAGVEKGIRTKILESDVVPGVHEKVQGGYGKYQGTWVPFERGVELAQEYRVEAQLKPLLDFEPPPDDGSGFTPSKEEVRLEQARARKELLERRRQEAAAAAAERPVRRQEPRVADRSRDAAAGASGRRRGEGSDGSSTTPSPPPSLRDPNASDDGDDRPRKRFRRDLDDDERSRASQEDRLDRVRESSRSSMPLPAIPNSLLITPTEQHRTLLMAIFLNDAPNTVPALLANPPPELDLNMAIDEHGHTALHWAAALARMSIVDLLLQSGANPLAVNKNGESALIRAVLVTNNFDNQTFPHLVRKLSDAISLSDNQQRNVVHHIVLTAGIKGRSTAARYYLQGLLEQVARSISEGGDLTFKDLVDKQDANGDTPLIIAARFGNKSLCDSLVEVGASTSIENKAGLKPVDYGYGAAPGAPSLEVVPAAAAVSVEAAGVVLDDKPLVPAATFVDEASRVGDAIQTIIHDLTASFTSEISDKEGSLRTAQTRLREVTSELTDVRGKVADLQTAVESAEFYAERVRKLTFVLEDEAAKVATKSEETSGPEAGGIAVEPDSIDAATAMLQTAKAELDGAAATLMRASTTPPTTELLCKKIISQCLSVPFHEIDKLLDPLAQAVATDGNAADFNLGELNRFMSRVQSKS